MKLIGSTKSKITEGENGEDVLDLEVKKVGLVHCDIFNNNYQQKSRALYTFIFDKSIGQLLYI